MIPLNPQDWLLLRWVGRQLIKFGKAIGSAANYLGKIFHFPEDPPRINNNGDTLKHMASALDKAVHMTEEERRSNVQLRLELDTVKNEMTDRDKKCDERINQMQAEIELLKSTNPNAGQTVADIK